MIYSPGNNKPVTGIYKIVDGVERHITAVYKGVRLIWSISRSCYGSGVWISEKPWLSNDVWKNNK